MPISVSHEFKERTNHKYVYNITAIENIPSIVANGILCHDEAAKFSHCSVALEPVQKRRERVCIPHGLHLHQYANLYFDYNNPMLYRIKDKADDICVLVVDASIMDNPQCIVSDRNAAADLVKFYPAADGIKEIGFGKIFEKNWNHENVYEYLNHKSIKCAEVLIPDRVPFNYVIGAYVAHQFAKNKLKAAGFNKYIKISEEVFYL